MNAVTKENYTVEQTATLVEGYKAGTPVEALAETVGKTVKSVVAKLVREGVYVSKAKVASGTRVTKADLVRKLEQATGATEGDLASLEKADKGALEFLALAFAD